MQDEITTKALSYLSRREYYRRELELKLTRKGYLAEDVQSVLNQLEQEKKLSNQRYMESFIHTKQRKLYGRNWIYMNLIQKGFSEYEINTAMDEQAVDWQKNLLDCYNKRRRLQEIDNAKGKAKLKNYLYRRGYSAEDINDLLNQ